MCVLSNSIIYSFSRKFDMKKCEFVCLLEIMHMHFYSHLIIFRLFTCIHWNSPPILENGAYHFQFPIAIDFLTKHYSNTQALTYMHDLFLISIILNCFRLSCISSSTKEINSDCDIVNQASQLGFEAMVEKIVLDVNNPIKSIDSLQFSWKDISCATSETTETFQTVELSVGTHFQDIML